VARWRVRYRRLYMTSAHSPLPKNWLARALRYAIVGSRKTVRQGIEALIAETAADELSVFTMIYDLDARRRSFEIVAEARDDGVVLAGTKPRHGANRAH
jgi:alkanesulfonate monooxygenase SsuD/methylene tetrahydromethanopterin reductase-like flavin-dependent oxidoreductase (luciferase family)